MTSNQIGAREARTKERELRERRRSNKENEALKYAELQSKYGTDVGRAAYNRAKGQEKGDEWGGIVTQSLERGAKIVKDLFTPIGKLVNDVSWYSKDPQLMKDTGSYSFNYPSFMEEINTQLYAFRRPGYVVLKYVPTLGTLGEGSAVGTTAAQTFYSFIRHANSGSRNYEAADLMIYILAVVDIYSRIAFLNRLYSLARTYKFHNRAYGHSFIAGLTSKSVADDIMSDLAGFRANINKLILKAGVLTIPKDISLCQRRVWMNQVIGKDDENHGSVDYAFAPEFFYEYTTNSNGAGCLVPQLPDFTNLGLFMGQCESALDAIFQDEDIGIMAGDILKAYGASGVQQIYPIPEDFHVESGFSLEVLSQIKNATLIFTDVDATDIEKYLSITQDNTTHIICYGDAGGDPNALTLKTNPGSELGSSDSALRNELNAKFASAVNQTIVDMYKDDVTPGDVMVATRLVCVPRFQKVAATVMTFYYEGAGTELATRIIVGEYLQSLGSVREHVYTRINLPSTIKDTAFAADMLSKPDWVPVVDVWDPDQESLSPINYRLHNFTVLSIDNVQRLADTAVFSEVSVPLSGLQPRF